MKSIQLTLSDPGLVAEFIGQEKFKAFFEKRLEVPPDYLGLLMRDGQFVQAYKGAHFTVGGVFNQIAGMVGGSHSISLLLADLKPFQSKYDFKAITKDKVEVAGNVAIEFQINPEKPGNIIGMMANRKALSKQDIADRLKSLLNDRVFEASVSRMNANEVRGNRGLQDLIQADMMKEVERLVGDLGVMIRHTSVEWAVNDVEKAEMARASAERAAEEAEYQFASLKREMERAAETTELKLTYKSKELADQLKSESDLQRMVMDQEIAFVDAKETGKRVQEMKVLAHEIELLKTERLFKMQQEIADATHKGVDMKQIEERKRKIERETGFLDKQHDVQLKTLEDEYNRSKTVADAKTGAAAAKFGFETRTGEADTKHYEAARALETQIESDKAALRKLEGMTGVQQQIDKQNLENRIREQEMRHKQEMERARLEKEREEMRLDKGGKLTPEQHLAMAAGANPAVAKIFEEQAKAAATGNQQAMDLMKQMVAQADKNTLQSADQAKALAEMIVRASTGVAQGVGAAASGKPAAGAAGSGATVDCPKCGRTNDAKDRFCTGCGEQLRR